MAVRVILALALVALAPTTLPASPKDWVPLRWDGGPLEEVRRHGEGSLPDDAAAREALRNWYDRSTPALLDDAPYNRLLLTWSLGSKSEYDAVQRRQASAYAAWAREKGYRVLAVIHGGPDWREAVEAAAEADFDGVVLEGEFPPGAADEAYKVMRGRNPRAVVVPMDSWRRAPRDPRFPVVADREGFWPGMLTPDEAEGWHAGPTSNPWVLSNAWRVGALRAVGADRPVWMGHRPLKPNRRRIEFHEYPRAVADSAMAGGRWVVALGDDFRRRLFARAPEALEQWRELSKTVRYFESKKQWRRYQVYPSVVVVHDPASESAFANQDVLNLLGVRHVPHRVVLRSELVGSSGWRDTRILAFDFAPPSAAEHSALQSFTASGGTLLTGPRFSRYKSRAGARAKRLVAGAGTIMAYPGEKLDADRFARDARTVLNDEHAAPRAYNVGTIMTWYGETRGGGGLLQMTEYGDYPTENVTVRFWRKFRKATMFPLGREPQELEVYEEGDGVEIVIPEVSTHCAVVLE